MMMGFLPRSPSCARGEKALEVKRQPERDVTRMQIEHQEFRHKLFICILALETTLYLVEMRTIFEKHHVKLSE